MQKKTQAIKKSENKKGSFGVDDDQSTIQKTKQKFDNIHKNEPQIDISKNILNVSVDESNKTKENFSSSMNFGTKSMSHKKANSLAPGFIQYFNKTQDNRKISFDINFDSLNDSSSSVQTVKRDEIRAKNHRGFDDDNLDLKLVVIKDAEEDENISPFVPMQIQMVSDFRDMEYQKKIQKEVNEKSWKYSENLKKIRYQSFLKKRNYIAKSKILELLLNNIVVSFKEENQILEKMRLFKTRRIFDEMAKRLNPFRERVEIENLNEDSDHYTLELSENDEINPRNKYMNELLQMLLDLKKITMKQKCFKHLKKDSMMKKLKKPQKSTKLHSSFTNAKLVNYSLNKQNSKKVNPRNKN